VVPPGDAGLLAEAIDRCLDAPRTGNLQEIVEPYRIDTSIEAFIRVLGDLVQAQQGPTPA
jgi:hypothetical protein